MKRGLKRPRINPDVWAEDVREWENCPPATYGESISRKCNIVFKGYEKQERFGGERKIIPN